MRRLASIFFIFMKTRIKGNVQYRGAFWLDTVTFVLGYGTTSIIMFLTIDKFDTINGWLPFEVVLLYAYVLASYTLANTFLSGVLFSISRHIHSGDFDQSLTKPLHPILYEMATSFSDYYFLHFFLSIAMIIFCSVNLAITFTFFNVLILVTSILGGALIQGGVFILFSSASFGLIVNPLNSGLFNNIRPLSEIPISIFPRVFQIILTTIIPLAFVAFYPAQNLLAKEDSLYLPQVVQNLSLPIGIVFFLFSLLVWNFAMRFYKSTGS